MPRLTPSEGALNAGSNGSDGSDGSDGPAPLVADFAADTTLAAGSLWKTCHPRTALCGCRHPRTKWELKVSYQQHDLVPGVLWKTCQPHSTLFGRGHPREARICAWQQCTEQAAAPVMTVAADSPLLPLLAW